jgi:hypothetical protein
MSLIREQIKLATWDENFIAVAMFDNYFLTRENPDLI